MNTYKDIWQTYVPMAIYRGSILMPICFCSIYFNTETWFLIQLANSICSPGFRGPTIRVHWWSRSRPTSWKTSPGFTSPWRNPAQPLWSKRKPGSWSHTSQRTSVQTRLKSSTRYIYYFFSFSQFLELYTTRGKSLLESWVTFFFPTDSHP